MSIWVTLRMKVKQDAFEGLKAFLQSNLPRVRSFDGVLSVSILYDSETGNLLIFEEWLSRAHHQAYIKFISENGVMKQLLAFMQGPPDVSYYNRQEL